MMSDQQSNSSEKENQKQVLLETWGRIYDERGGDSDNVPLHLLQTMSGFIDHVQSNYLPLKQVEKLKKEAYQRGHVDEAKVCEQAKRHQLGLDKKKGKP